MGFESLCWDCHAVKHMLIRKNRNNHKLVDHFMKINKVDYEEFQEHLQEAISMQQRLNKQKWKINFGEYSSRIPVLKNFQQRKKYFEHQNPEYV